MEMFPINYWAVFAATILNLVIGAIWYSPALFAKAWQKAAGLTDEQLKQFNPAKVFGITLIVSFVICLNLAFFISSPGVDWQSGATYGFLTGFGWATMIFIVISLFEQRSWSYITIHGGYITVYFTLAGMLIGAWQ